MSTVLVTGAAGSVAALLLPGLSGFDLRLTDARPGVSLVGDLTDPDFAASVVDGVDAVLHLAASPVPWAPWSQLRVPNIDGAATLLDAAAAAGVRRVVLASSVHALGGYARPGLVIEPSWPARPCCRYGATKAFAEAYGSVIAATTGTSVVCLRLGLCMERPTTTGNLAEWLAPEDLRGLVDAALVADVRFSVCFGVSANTRQAFDATNDLGFTPRFDSEVYAGEVREGPAGVCRTLHHA